MPSDIDRQLRELGLDPTMLQWEDTDDLFAKERAKNQMIPTSHSSNVSAIRYNPDGGILYVMFDNGREKAGPRLYSYFGITGLEEVYDDLFSAASPGGVVWDQLRRPGVSFIRM